MDIAACPPRTTGQRTPAFIHYLTSNLRAQRNELRLQLSALLCCELLPVPESDHATLCATVNHTLASYLATGTQMLGRIRQQSHWQHDPVRRRLLSHLLTHIDASSPRVFAFSRYCSGRHCQKPSFYAALAVCCRQIQLRFVLEEQLLEVLHEYPPYSHRQGRDQRCI